MKYIIATFVSIFISVSVFAAPMTPAEISSAKGECRTKYDTSKFPAAVRAPVALARQQCEMIVDMSAIGSRSDDADARATADIAQLRKMLSRLEEEINKVKASVDTPKPAAQQQPQQQAPQAQPMPPQGVMMGMGAPFQVVPPPANFAATWDVFGATPLRVEIYYIWAGGQKWHQVSGPTRVLIRRNGQTLPVMNQGGPSAQFYADMDGDGQADSTPYQGIDPNMVDTVYTGYQEGDVFELVYLTPVSQIAVSGMPLQLLWGKPRRTVFRYNSVSRRNTGLPSISARVGAPVYH